MRTIREPKSVFVTEELQRNATDCCYFIDQSPFAEWTGHRRGSSQSGWIKNSWFMTSQKSRPKSIFLTHHTRFSWETTCIVISLPPFAVLRMETPFLLAQLTR